MKKLLIFLILCVSLIYPINTYAKITTITDGEDYVVSSDYTFTPKFIKDVTTVETSSSYDSAEMNSSHKRAYRTQGYKNYWIMYKNIGMWEQHTVDLKITLEDVVDTDPGTACTAYGNNIDIVGALDFLFYNDQIAIAVNGTCRNQGAMGLFKIEYFDNETGEELNDIKTNFTYADIDSGERILLDNNKVKETIYYTPYAQEHLDLINDNFNNRYTFFKANNNWTCNGDNTCTSFKPEECSNRDCVGCTKAGTITTLNDGPFILGWSGYYVGFTSTGFLRIADPSPIILVDKESIKPGEELNYTIEQYVPNQSSEHHYKSWKITATLESILETSIDNINIKNDSEEDVTDKFNISLENNVVTVSAKEDYLNSNEFYSQTYLINIKTNVNSASENIDEIKNKAILNIQYNTNSNLEDLQSNEVQTIIEKEKEIIQIPNTAKFIDIFIFIAGIVLIGSGMFVIYRMKKENLQ